MWKADDMKGVDSEFGACAGTVQDRVDCEHCDHRRARSLGLEWSKKAS